MGSELTRPADILQAIASGDIPDLGDPKTVALSVIEQILRAETAEAIFDTGGTIATKDLVGDVFTLLDVRLMPGQIEDAALPVYALLDCVDENGERFVANTGAARVLGQAVSAKIHNLLPLKVRVVEIAAARPGQSAPLGLSIN